MHKWFCWLKAMCFLSAEIVGKRAVHTVGLYAIVMPHSADYGYVYLAKSKEVLEE